MFKKLIDFDRKHPLLCSILRILFFIAFVVLLLLLPDWLVPVFAKLPSLSSYSNVEIANTLFWLEIPLVVAICAFLIFFIENQSKKAKKAREERNISDYIKKYQSYVDLVQRHLSKPAYQTITLYENWVKYFDENLRSLALDSIRSKFLFSDFEIAAVFMYVLTRLKFCEGENVDVFAFDCVKEILSDPKGYTVKYDDWDEDFSLEVKAPFHGEKVDFSIPDPEISEQSVLALSVEYCYQVGLKQLADFFYILYKRRYRLT